MAVPTFTHKLIQLEPNVRIHTVLSEPPQPPGKPSPDAAETTIPTKSTTTALVFLHFWGGSTRTWDRVISSPGNLGLRCPTIALDFRGWGESTGPGQDDDGTAYSIATLARDVEAVLPQLLPDPDRRRFVLVGLSMGAKVAQLVAARNTVRGLQGVVLVSPAPPTALRLPPDMQEQQKQAYETAEAAAFVARQVLTVTYREGSEPPLPSFLVEDMVRGNAAARAAWPTYAMAEDISKDMDAVGGIAVPVLVLAAEHDVVEPLARVQTQVYGRLPAATTKLIKVMPRSGHLSPVDAPVEVAEYLLQTTGLW